MTRDVDKSQRLKTQSMRKVNLCLLTNIVYVPFTEVVKFVKINQLSRTFFSLKSDRLCS